MLVKQIKTRNAHVASVQTWGGGLRENDDDCYEAAFFPNSISAVIGLVEERDTWLISQFKVKPGEIFYQGVWCDDDRVGGCISDDRNGKKPFMDQAPAPNNYFGNWECVIAGNNNSDFSQLPPVSQFFS